MSATEELTGSAAPRTGAPAQPVAAGAGASAAGPAPADGRPIALPPAVRLPRTLQQLRFSMRQASFFAASRRRLGDTFRIRSVLQDGWVTVTSHPDHVRSLFTAPADLAPSLTGESPLRPIVGPSSVLTLTGPRHMRQRKLLLPPFHGEAVQRYVAMIQAAAEREIDRWPVGEPFALGPRMQAITLDVIMSGIFGIEGLPAKGTIERRLREEIRSVVDFSTRPVAILAEMVLLRGPRPGRIAGGVIGRIDELLYALIAERRSEAGRGSGGSGNGGGNGGGGGGGDEGRSILSLLLAARDEQGQPMSDEELRDELITLVLAGHETTANSLAWAFERLVRTPAPYARLRELVRGAGTGEEADAYVEAAIHEAMRVRPVIPSVGRRVTVPWQLGAFRVPAGTPIVISIVLLHHREDVYERPLAFMPERFLDVKPGTYTWIPFGGGIRRCLGATLAMAEQRVVMKAIARRTDMLAPEPAPERLRHRNVTMVPAAGARVRITRRTG